MFILLQRPLLAQSKGAEIQSHGQRNAQQLSDSLSGGRVLLSPRRFVVIPMFGILFPHIVMIENHTMWAEYIPPMCVGAHANVNLLALKIQVWIVWNFAHPLAICENQTGCHECRRQWFPYLCVTDNLQWFHCYYATRREFLNANTVGFGFLQVVCGSLWCVSGRVSRQNGLWRRARRQHTFERCVPTGQKSMMRV